MSSIDAEMKARRHAAWIARGQAMGAVTVSYKRAIAAARLARREGEEAAIRAFEKMINEQENPDGAVDVSLLEGRAVAVG